MGKKQYYAPVGHCIYCGSDGGDDGLTDEHIVPLSLGGVDILRQASCRCCQKITGAFEEDVTRKMYYAARVKFDFPTRHKKQRPKYLPMTELHSKTEKTILVKPKDAMAIMPLIDFEPPGCLRNPPIFEIGKEWRVPARFRLLGADYSWWDKKTYYKASVTVPINSYARMCAKIAHAYAVARCGYEAFEHELSPFILNEDNNIYSLVGGIPEGWQTFVKNTGGHYSLSLAFYDSLVTKGWLIVAQLWLLPYAETSPVCVVVGATTDKFERERLSNKS